MATLLVIWAIHQPNALKTRTQSQSSEEYSSSYFQCSWRDAREQFAKYKWVSLYLSTKGEVEKRRSSLAFGGSRFAIYDLSSMSLSSALVIPSSRIFIGPLYKITLFARDRAYTPGKTRIRCKLREEACSYHLRINLEAN